MNNDEALSVEALMHSSGVAFGTSGARGLVARMSDKVCYAYTKAFLQHLEATRQISAGSEVALAGDHRNSTVRILTAIARAIADSGYPPVFCGHIPSPAVAYYGLQNHIPSIMVTGSHIPDDRNGIKFNTAAGEILKSDENGIKQQHVILPNTLFDDAGMFRSPGQYALPKETRAAYAMYVKRYLDFFPAQCLAGKNIGLYQHSSVCREIFHDILTQLGAAVTPLGYSDAFISVDTEAIRPDDIELGHRWALENRFDAIVSADGDADRPLISDEKGTWLRGDIAGILTARYLGATMVATPVSSNTAVEKCGDFKEVVRTRIGSPFVIEAMDRALGREGENVVGYEANGGFLIGNNIAKENRSLNALPTRDAIIVALAVIMLSIEQGLAISQLAATLPHRFTASDRAKDFPVGESKRRLEQFIDEGGHVDPAKVEAVYGAHFGRLRDADATDGLRLTFENGEIVHLRPSGNAPEFRCYNEADSEGRAQEINKICMDIIADWQI